jgi:CheY-like chemotaxis protein
MADNSEGDHDCRVLTDEEALALDAKVRRGEELSPQDRQVWLAYHARHQRQGPKPWRPWTAAEDEMARTLPPQEVARRTGRSLSAAPDDTASARLLTRLGDGAAVRDARRWLMEGGNRLAPLRVLVVEDCPDTRDLLALLVRHWGYRSVVASDGRTGLAAALSERPDVILLDIALPDIDGYQVARSIRAQAEQGAVLLVALTGYDQEKDFARSLAAGFDLHLVKPVAPEELQGILARIARQTAGAEK